MFPECYFAFESENEFANKAAIHHSLTIVYFAFKEFVNGGVVVFL